MEVEARMIGESATRLDLKDKIPSHFGANAGVLPGFWFETTPPYLDGFSNRETADMALVRPQAIESVLDWGRKFIREELFAHLMRDDSVNTIAAREAASA
jgi:hypothetical protein